MTADIDSDEYSEAGRAGMKKLLETRLIESGWSDQVRMQIREQLKQNTQLNAIDIVQSVLPQARNMVPTAIKKELLQKLKDEILQEAGYYRTDN